MSTKPYDQAFKFLAEQDAESLLILLGYLQPGQTAEIELLPREVSVATCLPDQPYRIVTERGPEIIHIEAQTAYEAKLPERLLDYVTRLWLRYNLPIISDVLLLTPRGLPKQAPTARTITAGSLQLKVRYRLVRLWQIAARSILAWQRPNLLPFVPLMRGGWPELERGILQLNEISDERQQHELGSCFLVLGGLRYNRSDLLALRGEKSMIPLEQLKDSSIYQWIVEEGFNQARQQQVAELKDLFQQLAQKRFPQADLTAQLERINDSARLQQLCLDILDMPDAATLERHLTETAAADDQAPTGE